MITRQIVSDKLIDYLNREILLTDLVDWAENSVGLADFEPDEDIDLLMDMMMYLAGADRPMFSLTRDVLTNFMQQLGTPIKSVWFS